MARADIIAHKKYKTGDVSKSIRRNFIFFDYPKQKYRFLLQCTIIVGEILYTNKKRFFISL